MKLGAIFKRGANLFKLGVAARKFRKSTTEDQRHWAQNYLIELLGQSRGLPTKVGQFITMDSGDQGLRESLNNSLEPMHFEEVMELIEKAYGQPWDTIFKKLEKSSVFICVYRWLEKIQQVTHRRLFHPEVWVGWVPVLRFY